RHTRSKRDWSSDVCSSDLVKNHNYSYQCGFLHHIERTKKACKQTNRSVCLLFLLLNYLFKKFFIYLCNKSPFPIGTKCEGRQIRSEERRVGKECEARWDGV